MSLFQSIKGLFKNSAIYGLGHILSRFINFLLLPLYTNMLPTKEYGVVGLFFTYIAILFILYTYGLSSAFFRFFMEKGGEDRKSRVCSTTFYTLLSTSLLFSGCLMFFAEPVSRMLFSSEVLSMGLPLSLLIRMAAVILFFDSLGLLGYLVILSEQRPALFAVLKLVFVAVNVTGNIIFVVVMKMGVEGIFIANAAASFISMISVLPVLAKHLQPTFSTRLLKDLLAFGLPYIVVNASVVVMDTIDRPLIERLASIEQAGLFNAGVKLGMFMAIFVSAFRFAWLPFFMSHAAEENAKLTFSRVFTYLMLICLSVFLLLSFYMEKIVRIHFFGKAYLVGPEFWEGTVVVPPVLLAYVFYAAYLCFIVGIYLEKKTVWLSYITAAGMAGNIMMNLLLIPLIGMMGAAWARLGAYLIMAVWVYFIAQRFYRIPYEWKRIGLIGIMTAGLYFLGMEIPYHFRFILVLGIPVWLWMLRFWHPSETKKAGSVFKRLTGTG